MFLKITNGEKKEKGSNKGSSGQLVHYLEKENRLYKPERPEAWFNSIGSGYAPYHVKNRIDENRAKLCRDDAKFFLLNINPSQKEITHLKQMYGEQGARDHFQAFAVKIMDEYARNFNKEKVNGNEDLLWFAKLENHRYYSYEDDEVKNGTAKRGDVKPGEQMHIQVIISRKDITNKIKLSPATNHDGHNKKISSKMGEFNRNAFRDCGERVFDEMFGFTRPITETFRYANAQVNGGLAEKLVVLEEKRREEQKANALPAKDHGLESDVPGQSHTLTVLDMLLAKPEFDPPPALKRKKKRKKVAEQQSELNF